MQSRGVKGYNSPKRAFEVSAVPPPPLTHVSLRKIFSLNWPPWCWKNWPLRGGDGFRENKFQKHIRRQHIDPLIFVDTCHSFCKMCCEFKTWNRLEKKNFCFKTAIYSCSFYFHHTFSRNFHLTLLITASSPLIKTSN